MKYVLRSCVKLHCVLASGHVAHDAVAVGLVYNSMECRVCIGDATVPAAGANWTCYSVVTFCTICHIYSTVALNVHMESHIEWSTAGYGPLLVTQWIPVKIPVKIHQHMS